jgi:hypothetical protein
MSDEFDVALQMPSTDAGAEAVAVTHRHGGAGPAGDAPGAPPPDSTTAIRDQRVVSDSTRKAIKAIAELGKKAGAVDLGDELVPMEHDPAPAAAAPKPAAAAAAPAAIEAPAVAPPAAPAGAAQAAQATAAEIMARAEVDRLRSDHEQRVKDLDAREAKLAAREKLIPDRAAFAERPGAALATMLRSALGLGDKDDAELKEAISDLVTEASMEHLGVVLPDEVKTKMDARRALRTVKAVKQDVARQQEEMAAQREANAKADKDAAEQRDQGERERKAITLVRELVGGTKDSHPFIHAAGDLGIIEDPTAVVVELIRAQRARGEPADWQAAVRLANDHFKPKVEAAVKKSATLSALLKPAAPAGSSAAAAPAAVAAPASQQVGEQVRRPTTLTTTPTAAIQDPGTEDGPEMEDRYDRRHRHLRSVFAKHKGRFTPAES